jgi:N-glycosylase/DNA lyase
MISLISQERPLVNQLKKLYRIKKKEIIFRLKEFEEFRSDKTDEEIFTELAFCILTPQSKAKTCWDTIVKLTEQGLLLKGNVEQIKKGLSCVRFKNKKAEYIVKARKLFTNNGSVSIKLLLNSFDNVYACREWLVKNIVGFGYKEASHFLRNIGLGEKIAILDRHILKNLSLLGVIEWVPKSVSKAGYVRIEQDMVKFARQIDIPMPHLDLLLWCKETGEIFK